MKRLFQVFVMMMALMLSNGVYAQQLRPKQVEHINNIVREMTDVMDLSEVQAENVRRAIEKRILKTDVALKKYGKESEKFIEIRKEENKAFHETRNSTCSKEQLKKWAKHLKNKKK